MLRLISLLGITYLLIAGCTPRSETQKSADHIQVSTNHLANESSPYLLQHARNPVDWYPWGEKALAKAKAENKMLIISVGYAACHWCHVMEHESFEDTTVARIMNENFVAIKVDREERPDIDDIYMTACHMATGRGCGWPLNAFALPDGRPVWAGTYFPRKQWIDILTYFIKTRQEEGDKLESYAEELTKGIQNSETLNLFQGEHQFQSETIDTYAKQLVNTIDLKKGGRKGAPKFPMPNIHQFLLHHHARSGDKKSLKAVITTLDEMAAGGIYDHLGGGFARYSVDANWQVPHFEKMLYDNGQLVSLYAQAFQLTKNTRYKEVIEQTLEYIAREMTSPEGGFYSSLDADSEREEGKFYVWTKEEIDSLLSDEKTNKVFADYYTIKKGGNWEHNKNVLHIKKSLAKVAKANKITEEATTTLLASARAQLLHARAQRIRPGLDDKVLTSWNALMLKGYVDAYRALGKKAYLDIALRNADFLLKNMQQKDKRLNRNYKDGKSVINAFLDDYALLIDAFISLYQVTFDEQWLFEAKALNEYAIQHFYDKKGGLFFYTSDEDPALIARKKEVADNVISSSNSVMARNLFHLGTFLYDNDYLEMSKVMMSTVNSSFAESGQPGFYANWCSLYLSLNNPPYEVAIIGEDYAVKQKELLAQYLPDVLFLGGKEEGKLQLLKNKKVDEETLIYVCQNKTCKLPVREVDKALTMIK